MWWTVTVLEIILNPNSSLVVLYSWKIWQGIKFGGLAVYLCDCQINTYQYFIYSYNIIHMAIPYRTAKFKSTKKFLQWQFGAQPPSLIPTNISSYRVYM